MCIFGSNNIFSLPTRIASWILVVWEVATLKTPFYEYIAFDCELCIKNEKFYSLLHYRAIGARRPEYVLISELDLKEVIVKFSPEQAQAIIILAVMEKFVNMESTTTILDEYKRVLKECAENFQYQKMK